MKKSNTTLLILLISIIAILFSFGYQLPERIHRTTRNTPSWLEAKGPELSDTISATYHHLVCGFPLTSLDARLENTFIVRGSKNAIPFASARVKNDTLYLDYISHDPNYKVADNKVNGRYPIHLIVGSKNLRSIHVKSDGNIIIDGRSIGSKNNEPVYDSIDHIKNFQVFKVIDISLSNTAKFSIFMHADLVNLSTKMFSGVHDFNGHIKNLQIKYPEGYFGNGITSTINADSAFIYYNHAIEDNNAGRLNLNCSQYLYAELHADMDIYFKGNPVIEKVETDFGRVINWNAKAKEKAPSIAPSKIPSKAEKKEIKKINNAKMAQRRDSINTIRNTSDQLIKIPI